MYHYMPVLATYLGHKTTQSTEHYVRLCRVMFPELERKVEFINQQIYPELEYGND